MNATLIRRKLSHQCFYNVFESTHRYGERRFAISWPSQIERLLKVDIHSFPD